MKHASIVIGAGYGDEGKGVVTSTLANTHDLVVRFNGGSQAAHTVNYGDINHVFHHFGSGTLQYTPTYLAKEFITNPIIFNQERKVLEEDGISTSVFIDAKCKITTPFDMMINQAIESKRGDNRHGSCGLGINETVTRAEKTVYNFSVYNCAKNIEHMKDMLLAMFDKYYVKRADMLELNIELFKDKESINNILDHYIADFADMCLNSTIVDEDILSEFDNVLFEGAQGLMLDEEYGTFPHVTRSRTGMTNVVPLLAEHKLKTIPKVYYVTRHYATRHGAGPFDHEFNADETFFDATNTPNQWQGALRYGFLDVNTLRETIFKDKIRKFNNNLVVTCMDQKHKLSKEGYVFINRQGKMEFMQKKAFLKMLSQETKSKVWYTNSSQTRSQLKK